MYCIPEEFIKVMESRTEKDKERSRIISLMVYHMPGHTVTEDQLRSIEWIASEIVDRQIIKANH